MEHAKKAFFIIFTQKEYVIWEVESGRQENWSLVPLQSDGSFSLLLTKQKPGVEYYYIAGTFVYDRLFYSDIGTFSIPENS